MASLLRAEVSKGIEEIDPMLVSVMMQDLTNARLHSAVKNADTRKSRWLKEANRSTKFFFGLEPKMAKGGTFKEYVASDGQRIDDPKAVADYAVEFYRNLYSNNESDLRFRNEFLEDCAKLMDKLTVEQSSKCDSPITEEEVRQAIQDLKGGKTPGSDGLIIKNTLDS